MYLHLSTLVCFFSLCCVAFFCRSPWGEADRFLNAKLSEEQVGSVPRASLCAGWQPVDKTRHKGECFHFYSSHKGLRHQQSHWPAPHWRRGCHIILQWGMWSMLNPQSHGWANLAAAAPRQVTAVHARIVRDCIPQVLTTKACGTKVLAFVVPFIGCRGASQEVQKWESFIEVACYLIETRKIEQSRKSACKDLRKHSPCPEREGRTNPYWQNDALAFE